MASDHPQTAQPLLKYNPQIDGLRFCAVLLVVVYHWLPSVSGIPVSSFFGGIINFFFVLSSYLITRILFSAKEKSSKTGIPRLKVILVFFLRRTLRIFPAYYFFLLLVLLLPIIGNEIRDNAGMYFSYLANFHIFQSHDFPAATSHIWTLAVEEQFYLVWPLLILFVPHRHLLKTFIAIIIGSVILKAICYYPAPGVPQAVLTQYCVDAFAVGGLLAYKYTVSKKERLGITKYFNIVLYAGIPFGIIIILSRSEYLSFVFNRLLFAMISLKVVEGTIIGYKSYFGKFLQNKIVLYLGRISYGIYLYHLVVPIVFWRVYDAAYDYMRMHHASFLARHQQVINTIENVIISEGFYFFIYAVLVVGVAGLSASLIEKPINKLKVSINFDYRKQTLKPLNEPAA